MLPIKEREFLRNLVQDFTVKNPIGKKSEILNQFVKTGIARKNVYNTINKYYKCNKRQNKNW